MFFCIFHATKHNNEHGTCRIFCSFFDFLASEREKTEHYFLLMLE